MSRVVLCAIERFLIGAVGVALAILLIVAICKLIAWTWRAFARTRPGIALTRPRYVVPPDWVDNAFPIFMGVVGTFAGAIALHSLGEIITTAMGWCRYAH